MDSTGEIEKQEAIIEYEPEELMNYIPDADTTCALCQAEFLDPDDLKIHLDQVHKITSSVLKKCQLCTEEYSDMMAYAEHIRDNHLSSLKCCSYCWRVFDNFDEHRKHIKKHNLNIPESIYSCSQCKQKYSDLVSLKKHELEHLNAREGIFLYEVFPYLSAAVKVKFITFLESLGTDVVYTCEGCGLTSVDMNMYLRHVRSNECKVFICHTCGCVYKKKKNLVKHLQRKCNIFGVREKKTRLCPDCNTYITVVAYAKHKTICKPIKCYTCDITFASMNDWSEHQSKEHASMSVEVETCQYCWKRCVGSIAMKKHVDKTHRPEFHLYKYLCIYCKSVFKHPQKLFGHFVTKHKEILPYTCKICDKKFRFRKKFTIHIKLMHKSIGFVEFDENYHVFFTETKSEKPFIPKSIYADETPKDSRKTSEDVENSELNSDFMNATETEGNQTEVETKVKPKLKRKRISKINKEDTEDSEPMLKHQRTSKLHTDSEECVTIESSDDEPLLVVRKRVRLQKKRNILKHVSLKQRRLQRSNQKALTCNVCKKYCYTYQNYNHHVSLHSKHEAKKCIKCSKVFRSRSKLDEHIATDHSTSKLTETLKNLLEKRKTGGSLYEDLPNSEKFRRTIVKVNTEITTTCAKITPLEHKLSVQKFLENFVPEETKPLDFAVSTTTIKLVTGYTREPAIKMTKFKNTPISTSLKLAMPVKFIDHYSEKVNVSMNLVEVPCNNAENTEYYSDHYEDGPDMDRHESIPEVAEEVMLEGTEETQKPKSEPAHKIIIPKLQTEFKDIRIAHMLPEAPFYKIVKVKDVLAQSNDNQEETPKSIKLPDGTKLVTTNPLEHLLGNKKDQVLESVKNKYYTPKRVNIQGMLAKAFTMLEKPSLSKKRKKEAKNTEVSE